jgi:hypothetical protein
MRRLTAIVAALGLVLLAPAAAIAAPPPNDLPGGAIVLPGTLPQTVTADTTEATVEPAEDVGCGAGGTDQATVWYAFTPAADGRVLVDARDSDYWLGINVFAGTASGENQIACFENQGIVEVEAGTTYLLMFADIDGDATNGGALSFTLDVAPPPLEVTLTVDPVAKVSHQTGGALVSGTIACSGEGTAFMEISLRQRVGRYVIRAFGFGESPCGTEPTAWLAEVYPDNGILAGGKATGSIFLGACDDVQCAEIDQAFSVRLRR